MYVSQHFVTIHKSVANFYSLLFHYSHLAMRQVKDAALLLARRYNCQSSLRTAARISLVASEKQQGMVYAHKIMQQHLIQSEWTEAYEFLREQKTFQVKN